MSRLLHVGGPRGAARVLTNLTARPLLHKAARQQFGDPANRFTSHATAGMRNSPEVVGANYPQLRACRFCLQDRRLPLARQILEGVSVEQGLVELPALEVTHFGERRVG